MLTIRSSAERMSGVRKLLIKEQIQLHVSMEGIRNSEAPTNSEAPSKCHIRKSPYTFGCTIVNQALLAATHVELISG